MRIGFAANPKKDGAIDTRDELMRCCAAQGVCCALVEDAAALAGCGALDALVVAGGDGSLLRFAAAAAACGVPLLGINLGRIGFLSELSRAMFPAALERLRAGDYLIERRMMLRCSLNGGEPFYCLNDVLVSRESLSGVAQIAIDIDGTRASEVRRGDVLLVTGAERTCSFLRFEKSDLFRLIREKLS